MADRERVGRRLLAAVAICCAIAGLVLAASAMPMVSSDTPGVDDRGGVDGIAGDEPGTDRSSTTDTATDDGAAETPDGAAEALEDGGGESGPDSVADGDASTEEYGPLERLVGGALYGIDSLGSSDDGDDADALGGAFGEAAAEDDGADTTADSDAASLHGEAAAGDADGTADDSAQEADPNDGDFEDGDGDLEDLDEEEIAELEEGDAEDLEDGDLDDGDAEDLEDGDLDDGDAEDLEDGDGDVEELDEDELADLDEEEIAELEDGDAVDLEELDEDELADVEGDEGIEDDETSSVGGDEGGEVAGDDAADASGEPDSEASQESDGSVADEDDSEEAAAAEEAGDSSLAESVPDLSTLFLGMVAVLGVLGLAYFLYTRDDPIATLRSLPGRLVGLAMSGVVAISQGIERAISTLGRLESVRQLPRALVSALAGVLASIRARLPSGQTATASSNEHGDEASGAAGSTATATGPRAQIRRAFGSVITASGLYGRAVSTTNPSTVASRAKRAGAPAEPVETITDSFRDVEYGDRPPERYLERTTAAHERLQTAVDDRSADSDDWGVADDDGPKSEGDE